MKCTLHKKRKPQDAELQRRQDQRAGQRLFHLRAGCLRHSAGTGEPLWHLKLLTAEQEETTLPQDDGCDRVLMVLDGEAVFSYENQRVAGSKPWSRTDATVTGPRPSSAAPQSTSWRSEKAAKAIWT